MFCVLYKKKYVGEIVWHLVFKKKIHAQTWPPWPNFEDLFLQNELVFSYKTWGIIRELLLYPKHIFTDFWNNGKWRKENVAQIQLPVTCGTCNTLHFELIRAVITVVVNNIPPAFNNLNIIQFQTVLVKASASQKQPADRHHAVVPKWVICAIFIYPLPVTLKIRKNMFWIE